MQLSLDWLLCIKKRYYDPLNKKSKAVLLNFALVSTVALYTFLGAFIFQCLESSGRNEEIANQKYAIRECAAAFLREWRRNMSGVTDESEYDAHLNDDDDQSSSQTLTSPVHYDYTTEAPPVPLDQYQEAATYIFRNCTLDLLPWDEWSYLNAVAFSFTVMTTVGYGKLAPKTTTGRIFCIFFAVIGIPLTMLILANMGKHLSALACKGYMWCRKRRKQRQMARHTDSEEAGLHNAQQQDATMNNEEDDEEDEDEEAEPTGLVVLFVFLTYVMIGALMMPLIEQIDFITSVYTNVMSVTAVDFSLIVGGNIPFVPLKLLYACVGLAITTVAIEAGSNYLRKLHYFGRKINVSGVKIWVGGEKISVNHLVRAVGRQAGVDLDCIQHLDLNRVVESAVAEESGFILPEEEQALLNTKKDPNRIRFIDSDTDQGGRDPPPPPPPGSQPPSDEDMGDSDYKSGNEGSGGDSSDKENRRDSGNLFTCAPFSTLADIPEEHPSGSVTPEPRSPMDSVSFESPVSDSESEPELIGDEWSPSPPAVATPRLLHHDWAPSPPEPTQPRLVGPSWQPSSPDPVSPRLVGWQWTPSSPDAPEPRVIGSQWQPSPPRPASPRLIGFGWSPSPPTPKAPTPPREPSPIPPEPDPEPVKPPTPEPTVDEPIDPEPSKPKYKPFPARLHSQRNSEWAIPDGYDFEQLYKNAVRKASKMEIGRRRTRADAQKRYELYQQEWAKVERLTRPMHELRAQKHAALEAAAAATAAQSTSGVGALKLKGGATAGGTSARKRAGSKSGGLQSAKAGSIAEEVEMESLSSSRPESVASSRGSESIDLGTSISMPRMRKKSADPRFVTTGKK